MDCKNECQSDIRCSINSRRPFNNTACRHRCRVPPPPVLLLLLLLLLLLQIDTAASGLRVITAAAAAAAAAAAWCCCWHYVRHSSKKNHRGCCASKMNRAHDRDASARTNVESYDGRVIGAQAFVTPSEWKLPQNVAPPDRYLKLIRDGCKDMGIDLAYQQWLQSISSNKGQRGPEYWDAPANTKKKARVDGSPRPGAQKSGLGPLKISALSEFAVGHEGLVDIGANLGKCAPQDLAAQLLRASAANVSHVILTGCSVKGSLDASRICQEWAGPSGWSKALQLVGAAAQAEIQESDVMQLPCLSFTAGVHPHDAKRCDEKTIEALRSLASQSACVSLGECGLDYDRMFSPREIQLLWCRKQVELAVELRMPLFLHERDRDGSKGKPLGSSNDLLGILADCNVDPKAVCVHCFTGQAKELEAYISRGYFIGLTGFAGMKKRGAHIRELLRTAALPLKQLMIETDCPFMMPDKEYFSEAVGVRGRTNEPCLMPAVCRAVAECLEVPAEEVAKVTTENAKRFFSL
ncbi:tatD [Symbiodinium pilosum]|uniref:TatD protein n=1 Tax=Symbiodinium pilosum TaxID=2952 RepID=A0A812XRV3_SYMPI|nr:tatD [Symbiodinium pilosum]